MAEAGDHSGYATGESQLDWVASPSQTPWTAVFRPVLSGVSACPQVFGARLNPLRFLFK